MRKQILLGALLAVTILTVGASASFAARSNGTALFIFNGRMLADAGSGSTISVDVNGGNRAALKKLVGQSDNANFAVDAHTQYLRWTHGVPTVVTESNLLAGDRVSVRIVADRQASLAQIEGTAARRVADSGKPGRFPSQPLWLFRGTLDAPGVRRSSDAAHRRRQPARAPGDARPAARPDLPLRRAHHLRALAGTRPDAHLPGPAAPRRPDLGAHPRPAVVLARPGRTGSGEPRRRPRAGRFFLLAGPPHERGRTRGLSQPSTRARKPRTSSSVSSGCSACAMCGALLHARRTPSPEWPGARPRRSPA